MTFSFKSSADVYAESIEKLNAAVGQLATSQTTLLSATEAIARQQQRAVKASKKAKEATEEAEKVNSRLAKSYKTLADGTREYHNFFGKWHDKLSSTTDSVTLFGFKAASVRKLMYGFLPRGMFRGMNKLTTVLNSADFAMRKFKKNAKTGKEELGFLGKSIQKLDKMTSLKVFKKIGEGRKQHLEAAKGHFAQSTTGRRAGSPLSSSYVAPDKAALRGFKSLRKAEGAKSAQRKEMGHLLTANVFRKALWKTNKKMRRERRIDSVAAFKKIPFFKLMSNVGQVILRSSIFFIQMAFLGILLVSGIFVIWKAFGKEIMEALTIVWDLLIYGGDMIYQGMLTIYEGALLIWDAFFGDGNFTSMLEGVITMIYGVLQILWGVAVVVVTALFSLLIVFLVASVLGIYYFFEEMFTTGWKGFFKQTAILIAVGVMIWLAILGAPFLVIIAVGVLVWKVVTWFLKAVGLHASGGVVSTPLQVVGEKGPELVTLPKGSRVHSNSQSKSMTTGSKSNTVNVTINARDTSDAELRRIAEKVGKMINNNINRSTTSRTMG